MNRLYYLITVCITVGFMTTVTSLSACDRDARKTRYNAITECLLLGNTPLECCEAFR